METVKHRRKFRPWLTVTGAIFALVIIAIVTVPLWIRPMVEAQASAALGRKVTIGKLAFRLSPVRVIADEIKVAGTSDVPDVPYLATVNELAITLDLHPLLHGHMPIIPDIAVVGANIEAIQTPDGANNYTFASSGKSGGSGTAPQIGAIYITDSHAHMVMPHLGADMTMAIHTEGDSNGQIIADLTGTYHDQPITGKITGGAILSLRDASNPYPVDIRLANGEDRLALTGTISDPIHLAGSDLKLELSGQDLSSLYPLLGIPIPPTTPFKLIGSIDYQDRTVKLTKIDGRLGNTDVGGDLTVDLKQSRPILSGALASHQVDLEDLAGFIGAKPGRVDTPGQTAEQKREVAQAIASPKLLPTVKMDIPKLQSVDFHLTYHADKIIGKSVPFDTLATGLDIEDGRIKVTDLRIGVGSGQILAQIEITPVKDSSHTVADIKLQRLDIQRMLAATHLVQGAGVLGGEAQLDATGRSLAEMLGGGNGHLYLFVAGGDVSAIAVDLSGLKLGSAVLSALGLPDRAEIHCLVGDLSLTKGVLQTQTFIFDTTSDRTSLSGNVNLSTETMDAVLRTQSKHFTIGTLAAPINIKGTLKSPDISPDKGTLGARTAAAVGLGILLPPAALLPTIQLGIGEDNACVTLIKKGDQRSVQSKPVPRHGASMSGASQ